MIGKRAFCPRSVRRKDLAKKDKTLPGPCKEVREGYTEHGGCVSVIYYFDSHYKPVPKDQATRAILHEYDEKERSVFRDYFTMESGRILPPRGRGKQGEGETNGESEAGETPKEGGEQVVLRQISEVRIQSMSLRANAEGAELKTEKVKLNAQGLEVDRQEIEVDAETIMGTLVRNGNKEEPGE